jgi:hypothetical protein
MNCSGDHGPLPLHSSVDADYAKAMRRTSNPVPDGRVLVFLKVVLGVLS